MGTERMHGDGPGYGGRGAPAGSGAASDVIVVGAGPAGSVSALLLARAGLRVTLLDRSPFPRPKPCGDCLSAGATGLLDRLGLLDRVLAAGPARLTGWTISAPGGHACHGRFDGTDALAIERWRLDDVLFRAALEAGAAHRRLRVVDLLRDDAGRVSGVAGIGPDGERVRLRARLVVGADGLRSIVARRLGVIRRPPRRRKVSLTFHGQVREGGAGDLARPDGRPSDRWGEMRVVDGGCIGVAPVGPGRFNITLVADTDRAPRLAELGPHAFLREVLRAAPDVAARIDALELDDDVHASGPFDQPTAAAARAGAALVGDAAGYYDPFTGQGVYRALRGAELLARMIAPALQEPGALPRHASAAPSPTALDAALRHYDRRLRAATRDGRRLQRVIDWALRRPGRADAVVARLARAPAVVDRLVQVTGDLRHPRSLLSPPLLSTFLFPPLSPEAR